MPRFTGEQRLQLEQLKTRLANIEDDLETALEEIDTFQTMLQDTFDERSEKWQESEKGEEYQEFIDSVEERVDEIRDVYDTVQSVNEELRNLG